MSEALIFAGGVVFGILIMCVVYMAKDREQPFEQDMTGGSGGNTEGVRSVENERT